MITPHDESQLEIIKKLTGYYKIGSGEAGNYEYIEML